MTSTPRPARCCCAARAENSDWCRSAGWLSPHWTPIWCAGGRTWPVVAAGPGDLPQCPRRPVVAAERLAGAAGRRRACGDQRGGVPAHAAALVCHPPARRRRRRAGGAGTAGPRLGHDHPYTLVTVNDVRCGPGPPEGRSGQPWWIPNTRSGTWCIRRGLVPTVPSGALLSAHVPGRRRCRRWLRSSRPRTPGVRRRPRDPQCAVAAVGAQLQGQARGGAADRSVEQQSLLVADVVDRPR